jgi:diaminopimelate dehydrogenase
MSEKIKVAVMGYGHLGVCAVQAIQLAPDMTLSGIIDLPEKLAEIKTQNPGVAVVADFRELPNKPDVCVLTVPSRTVEKVAPQLLDAGIHTVDPFDMHGEPFTRLKATLDPITRKKQAVAIMGSGVDPGVSSMIRALFELWAPTGLTYVSFGPGMSMGHTVVAKSYDGVRDALSITLPGDPGCHKRDLYLEIKEGYDFEEVKGRILKDSYFSHDNVRVFQVEDVTPLIDLGHAIHITRKGGSSGYDNQLLNFDTTFHNPASTAQVMVSSARACMRLAPGAYTMLEVPLSAFLSEDIDSLMARMV